MIRDILEVDPQFKGKIKDFIHKVGLEWTPECENAEFLVMESAEAWAAVIGIGKINTHAVLRTLVLDPKQCDGDDLMRLMAAAVIKAERLKADGLYFLTVATSTIFEPLGFKETTFSELPEDLKKDPLFNKESQSARIMTYTFKKNK